MSHNCPICGVRAAKRSWYEGPHGLVETHVECVAGCGLYEDHYSYGAHYWKVAHHTFAMPGEDHPAECAHERVYNLMKRTCAMVAERRLRQRQQLMDACVASEQFLRETDPHPDSAPGLLLRRVAMVVGEVREFQQNGKKGEE